MKTKTLIDNQMELIAALDCLERNDYRAELIDRIQRAVNDHDRLHERIEELEEQTFQMARLKRSHEALINALKEVSNAANVCAAHDQLNASYWFAKQKIVNEAIAQAEARP